MSWIKRRGPSTPSPAPVAPVPMYNPNQHSTQEAWQNQQVHDNWYSQSQQQYHPATQPEPQSQPQPQPQQNYWQSYNAPPSGYNQNAQPPQQQQQYPQQYQNQSGYYPGYEQQAYGNSQYNQQYNQNNLYQPTNTHQQGAQQNDGDAWNWGWGDEDNSNVQTMPQQPPANSLNQGGNSIGDSFAKDGSWNWGAEDTKPNVNPVQNVPKKEEPTDVQGTYSEMDKSPHVIRTENDPESIRTLPPQDLLKVSGKRGKLETPQWSTESQMSQESSDDILHTSESDKSHMMSRSSTISHSPLSAQEPSPSQNLDDVPSQNFVYFGDLASNHQFENKEIISNIKMGTQESRPPKVNTDPSPPKNTQTPPLLPPMGNADDSKNPYKRSTGLSHKAASIFRASNTTPPDSRQNLHQPGFHNQQVNLETLPDNSEQPDQVPNQTLQKIKPVSQWPENNEAPINDRNQYLETGQLSGAILQGTASVWQEPNDTLPPPGLRRMVPGQMEQNESLSSISNFGDEPPPGLNRMVLGQTMTTSNTQLNLLPIDEDVRVQYEPTGPPEGLRRMVPGESSSPESTLRNQQQRRTDNDSESELDQLTQHAPQPRSATIGADTPPAISNPLNMQSPTPGGNRSETIGGGDSTTSNQDEGRTSSTSAVSNNKSDKNRKSKAESLEQKNRRDSIEGETQESEISKITNSVRNLTVGENLTDGHTSNTSLPEPPARRHSRQESSDSDKDIKKLPRSSRDKRSLEKVKRDKDRERDREREKYRYSPESYKDRKYDRRRYKDRRYEDDTDYYSDKEKDRRTRDERDKDYERKYSSLRKDKDKDKRRRDPRDYGRDRRGEYYYTNRYDDDYEADTRSRPSSRSDSIHESYRERGLEKDHRERRHRDRERDRYRRHRDPREMYNPYQGSAYDPYNPYYQQYQYYENLRRTNPQAYAEWYRKYYQQATGQASSYGGAEDRASVHSGRSSANDELAKDRYTRQSFYSQASIPHLGGYYGDTRTHSISGQYGLDSSSFARPFDHTDSSLNFEDNSLAAQRLTPAKFATAHIKASIASGKLLRILPHYPMDGQNAIVEVCNLQAFFANDEEYKEISQFPGPLVKGVTHKKTIIEYCENKIRDASCGQIGDVDSYILMWELLILLIRQNGMVVGTDIAELLLKNKTDPPPRPSSVISNISSSAGEVNPTSETSNHVVSENTGSTLSVLKEEEVTSKFREFLLYGSGKEALEWAMRHGLWGHALFLASKLDKRTYANVMMRFANGLTLNDPLQTLYQLLSGKMPAAVTCVADEKWGDWRPHLAMILSNSTQRPELNCKAITTLGDTLSNRGSLYAAQFCYLMAEVGFGRYDDPETRLTLLGADHSKGFPAFVSNEAVHMTEIYEYACSLNDADFIIPEFQTYKYLLATRLADYGLLEKSLQYLEKISTYIVSNPAAVQPSFIDKVSTLADRLKFYDPVGEVEDESEFGDILETSRPENSWLKDLRAVQNDYQSGLLTHEAVDTENSYVAASETDMIQQTYDPNGQEAWQQQYDQQYQQSIVQQQQAWQPEQQQQVAQVEYQQQENLQQNAPYQEQQNYWSNQQQQQQWGELNQFQQESVDQQHNYYGSNAQVEPKEVQKDSPEETPLPQISMPNQSMGQSPYSDGSTMQESSDKKSSPLKPKPQSPAQEKTQSTGWFGGIFSKLALKPKNQMKLPDDKNPKIVWDQDKKKWINVDEDPNEPSNEFKPPPKLSDLMPKSPSTHSLPGTVPTYNPIGSVVPQHNVPTYDLGQMPEQPSSMPGAVVQNNSGNAPVDDSANAIKSNQPNMFKLQRGRNLKNSYIDVFNPGGKPSSGPASLPPIIDKLPSATPQMNFFIPQPMVDSNAPIDFLTPGGVPQLAEQQL